MSHHPVCTRTLRVAAGVTGALLLGGLLLPTTAVAQTHSIGVTTMPPVIHVPPPVIVPHVPGGIGGAGVRVDMGPGRVRQVGPCGGRQGGPMAGDGCAPRPRLIGRVDGGAPVSGQPRSSRIVPPPPPRFTVPPGERRFVPNEVLLQVSDTMPADALAALERRLGLTRIATIELPLTGVRLIHARISSGRSVREVLAALSRDARIIAAQPNFRFATPRAKFRLASVSSHGAGAATALQYAVQSLRLPQAHQQGRGDEVVVAVIDSAVDTGHPELAGALRQTVDVSGVAGIAAAHDHGTAMAGAIAAHGQLVGAAPAAALVAITAFRPEGEGANGTSVSVLRALEAAYAARARVVNMSFAGPRDALLGKALASASQRGMILVAAAGNAGPASPPLFPAADPSVIAVTAIDSNDRPFGGANRGDHLSLAAPGVDVLVPGAGGTYDLTSGTSVAAAYVSGVIALMLQRNPTLDAAGVRRLLEQTARDLGAQGRDEQFGAGAADAFAAVQAVAGPIAASPAAAR